MEEWPLSQLVASLSAALQQEAVQLIGRSTISTECVHATVTQQGLLVQATIEPLLDQAVALVVDAFPTAKAQKPQLNYPGNSEPYCLVTVSLPSRFAERVLSDLVARGALVKSSIAANDQSRLQAECPMAALLGYSTTLRFLSQALGSFEQSFIGYRPIAENGAPAAQP
jgi:translation elongation factor EF-G